MHGSRHCAVLSRSGHGAPGGTALSSPFTVNDLHQIGWRPSSWSLFPSPGKTKDFAVVSVSADMLATLTMQKIHRIDIEGHSAASSLEPRMLVWLAGARLHAGRSAVPFDGADAACLVAFAHPPDVAASLESWTCLLRCTLQLAGRWEWLFATSLAFWHHVLALHDALPVLRALLQGTPFHPSCTARTPFPVRLLLSYSDRCPIRAQRR